MATFAADSSASMAQTHIHRGGGGQMKVLKEAQAKTGLKEAVDAVVSSFAKHTHMGELWELEHFLQRLQTSPVLWSPPVLSTAWQAVLINPLSKGSPQDPVKLIEQTYALISQGLILPSAT
ncbi:hypothetical protein ACOMHN_047065 [Nucella lapillus]